jgi:methionyl-tRNA synthetase
LSIPDIVSENIEHFKFREGLIEIIRLAKFGNKYFNDKEPWKAVKENPEGAANCIYLCNQLAKVLSVILAPYIPVRASKIMEIMNLDVEETTSWKTAGEFVPAGHKIGKPKPLFSKIDDNIIKKEKETLYDNLEETETMKDIISIDDFAKMDLRISEIIGAERVEGSENLLKLMVDTGEKKIQVVAGLAKKYAPEEIKGQKVVVLVNLKPAKLFGIKSEGMILATSDSLSVLSADAHVGEKIK